MSQPVPSLLEALRLIGREIARQDDPVELVAGAVRLLREVGGLSDVRSLCCSDDCVRCQACPILTSSAPCEEVFPMWCQGRCQGALLLARSCIQPGQRERLSELAQDLGAALLRLRKLQDLNRRDRMRREIEHLGQLGGWELAVTEGQHDWTEGVARIHDLPESAPPPGLAGLDYFSPECRPILQRAVERAIQEGESYDLTLQLIGASGQRKWVRSLGRPVLEEGRVVRVCGLMQDVTQQRTLGEELRDSQYKLEAFFERAGIGLAECHYESGRFHRVNRKLCEILGFSAAELLQMTWLELAHPDDRELEGEQLGEFLSGRMGQASLERRYLRKDGSTVWVRVTLSAQTEEEYSIVNVEDISDRHAALQSLAEQKERLNTIFDFMLAGIVIVRVSDRRIIQINPAAERLLGWSLEEVRGKTLLELGAFAQPEDLLELRRRFDEGWLGPTECRLRLKAGGEIDVLVTGGPAQIDGEACAIGIWHDITELRRSREALREKDREMRVMFKMAPVGIALCDAASGLILNANNRFSAITGYCLEELRTLGLAELAYPEDRELTSACFSADERGEQSEFHAEQRYLRKDGRLAWVRSEMTVLRSPQGEPERTILVVEDITQAKESEQKLREAQEQLQAAQKMEAIGRLAGGVAHDFNNLLTVILSYTELSLSSVEDSDPLHSDLLEIYGAGERARELTRQLLAFSRRQVMSLEWLDMNSIVTAVQRMLARLLGEDIKVMLNLDDQTLPVHADQGQVEQVLFNLAINARDAMPQGGVLEITTRCLRLEAEKAAALEIGDGDYVCLEIRDTGCGISRDTQARMFEPFFTTKELGKGTGLGLSMVYGIVRQTGGGIEVCSELGQGSCFRVYLPAGSQAQVRSPESGEACLPLAGSETILLVEDEPALLQVASRALSSEGYRVLCAHDGFEAQSLCEEQGTEIDLVLSDVIMPGITGPQLLDRLRPLCPKARFLLMSGYPAEALAGHGVATYLCKPFDGPGLRRAVREALEATPA